jgi:hypothetical protein
MVDNAMMMGHQEVEQLRHLFRLVFHIDVGRLLDLRNLLLDFGGFFLDSRGQAGGECSVLRGNLRLSRCDRRVRMMDEFDLLGSGAFLCRLFGFDDRFGRFLLFGRSGSCAADTSG